MPVVEFTEIWSGREMTLGERWMRTYKRVFRVRTNTQTDGAIQEIQAFNGIPLLYSSYTNASNNESDLLALCNKISASQQNPDDPFEWTVSCDYSTRTFDPSLLKKQPGQDTSQTDPLSRLPDVQWSFISRTKPLVYDMGSTIYVADGTGNPLTVANFNNENPIGLNGFTLPPPAANGQLVLANPQNPGQPVLSRFVCDAAGVPFDPPIEMDDSQLVCNYRRNEAAINLNVMSAYKDAVNTDLFLAGSPNIIVIDGSVQGIIPGFAGFPPGTVKCNNIGAVRKFESKKIYWEINYEFAINFNGWYFQVQNAGYYQLDANGNRVQITDQNGNPVVTPWPLDINGKALTKAQIDQGQATWRFFFGYREMPFAPLQIT